MPIRRQSCFADRKHFITNMDRQGRLWQKRKRKTWWGRLPKWLRGTIIMALVVVFFLSTYEIRRHMIIDVPLWIMFILPFAAIVFSLYFLYKINCLKEKGQIVWKTVFATAYGGFFVGGIITILIFDSFVVTNYVFADSESYKRAAVVESKHRRSSGRSAAHYDVHFVFTDNNERFVLNDYDVFNKLDKDDKAFIILKDGLWGVPIVTDVDKIIN